jgi:hypothetical protein
MNIDLKKLEEYKKADSFARVYFKLLFPMIIFWVVLGFSGMIADIVRSGNQDTNGFLFAATFIILLVFPVATFLLIIPITNYDNKKFEILRKELFDSKMLAEDILKLGEENGIDLLNVAIAARCIHELGWEHVPEEYGKERIMPDKKE